MVLLMLAYIAELSLLFHLAPLQLRKMVLRLLHFSLLLLFSQLDHVLQMLRDDAWTHRLLDQLGVSYGVFRADQPLPNPCVRDQVLNLDVAHVSDIPRKVKILHRL